MLTGWNLLNVGFCGALENSEMREGGRSLVCLPLFHIGGTVWAIWAMQTGSTVVIVRDPVPEVLVRTMVEQRIESALLVPTLMLLMTELPQARTADFSALKLISYGTAPISPDPLRRSIETFKCRFLQVYGLTETTGPFTALSHEQHVGERLLSCGRPMLGSRVRIVNSDGKDLPPYEVGEILYQGENLMAGYWAREEATAQAILSEESAQRPIDACWFEAAGDIVQGISDKARYADLVILGQYEWQGSPETHPLPIGIRDGRAPRERHHSV
jgi:acyl-CoA synthetase (AMP-forming)/AMP-acid ligase II